MNWPKKVMPAVVPLGFAIAAPSNIPCASSASCSFVCWLSGGRASVYSEVSPTGNIRPKLDGSCGSCARRRAQASIAHIAGESTGATGSSEANGFRPTDDRTFDTTSVATFGGADGSLIAFATVCVSGASATAEAMPATDSTAVSVAVSDSAVDAGVETALSITVDCWFAEVELADPVPFVTALPAEFGAVCDSPRGVSGVAASCATSDVTDSAEGAGAAGCSVGDAAVGCWVGNVAAGGSAGAAVAMAEGTPVSVGVAPADAVVSLLDGEELVCAPPELCTTPERGSSIEASLGAEVELAWPSRELCTIPAGGSPVDASLGAEVELAWASTELCTVPDVEPDGEPAADADEFADEVGPVDDALAADSDDELDVDDDEPDDELEELVSVGSANATPGVAATAPPAPSATANTPARTMYCVFTGIALRGQPARAPAERLPGPA
jgi:hypothetical protein